MDLTRNAKGGYKVSTKAPRRRKRMYDGRCYEDAQPWHPDTPRVRVPTAQYVTRAFLTALHALSGHSDEGRAGRLAYCLVCNPEWR